MKAKRTNRISMILASLIICYGFCINNYDIVMLSSLAGALAFAAYLVEKDD